jgi:tetrapyrrole methylase family protein/MazG family protein
MIRRTKHPVHKKNTKRALSKNSLRRRRIRSLLDGIPDDLPSLCRAHRITRRVSNAGFDWPNLTGVLAKVDEEMGELREALSSGDRKRIREEIGDLLFVLVNLARFLEIDPEGALKQTIHKFISRFRYIEESLQRKGKTLLQSDLTEMDGLWEEAKRKC